MTCKSKLIKCRCSATRRDFVIRLDQLADKSWQVAYSFPMTSSMTATATESVSEDMTIFHNPNYTGCCYCMNIATNFCSCGGVFCAEGDGSGKQTCPICGGTADYCNSSDFTVKTFCS